MMTARPLKDRLIVIRGAGEMATGVACRLYRANLSRLLLLETRSPLAVRRRVSFCEAVHDGTMTVEGVEAVRADTEEEIAAGWAAGKIPVRIDPAGESIRRLRPDVVVDAILAKRNLGTRLTDAPLVIALGPGFTAGEDCHVVVETNRGHDLGRLIRRGQAEADTGVPGEIGGFSRERVLRAPADGFFSAERRIGERVRQGERIGSVAGVAVTAAIDGVLRGLIRPGCSVGRGLKIGDIDPRGETAHCDSVSDKAHALGGAVLEAVLADYNH